MLKTKHSLVINVFAKEPKKVFYLGLKQPIIYNELSLIKHLALFAKTAMKSAPVIISPIGLF